MRISTVFVLCSDCIAVNCTRIVATSSLCAELVDISLHSQVPLIC